MAVSVVVSQIAFDDSQQSLHVKGTVATNAFQTALRGVQDTLVNQVTGGTPNAIANAFLQRYNLYTAAVAAIASSTINYQSGGSGTTTPVVFGGTPVVIVGYEYLEITATVGGNSTILHLSQDDFYEYYGAGKLNDQLASRLFAQNGMNQQLAAGIATFSI